MRRRLVHALLFAGLFGFFGLFARGHLESGDSIAAMQGAHAWWLRGDPGLLTEVQAAGVPGDRTWPLEYLHADRISDPIDPKLGRVGAEGRSYVWFPIGHQALFVPCVALGRAVHAAWPAPARAAEREVGSYFGAQFWPGFFASFWSPLAGAGSFLMLLLIALALGTTRRGALLTATVATLGTQFWPGTTETMSNAPGAFFLFATVLAIVRYARGAGPLTLLIGGCVAGIGVLVRYPQAVATMILAGLVCFEAYRRGRLRDVAWFVLGALPWAGLFLWLNHWRFGDMLETGYSNSAGFGGMPPHIGAFLILCAWGKGVLWFTPLLFVVLPSALTRRARSRFTLVAGSIFVATLATYSIVVYWAAGQCWGIRYMSAPIALLSTVVLAQTRPWERWPRRFAAVSALGLVVTLGGIVTPYPGQQHYALAAAEAVWGDLPNLDNNVNHYVPMSPIHSHWTYAWLSATGRLDVGGSANTTEPMFGVQVDEVATIQANQRRFRHVWMRWLGYLAPGFPSVLVAVAWVAATAACLVVGLRNWLGAGRPAGP